MTVEPIKVPETSLRWFVLCEPYPSGSSHQEMGTLKAWTWSATTVPKNKQPPPQNQSPKLLYHLPGGGLRTEPRFQLFFYAKFRPYHPNFAAIETHQIGRCFPIFCCSKCSLIFLLANRTLWSSLAVADALLQVLSVAFLSVHSGHPILASTRHFHPEN